MLRISLPMGRSFITTPAPSTGSPRVSATVGPPRSISTRCGLAPTPTTLTASSSASWLEKRRDFIIWAGRVRLTLYQIGQIVNRVGGYDPHLLKGCPRREAGPIPPALAT